MLTFTSCANKKATAKEVKPEITQMMAICELAVMECYYHNVGKYYEENAEGMLWWEKDRHFWIEYAGIVTVGIDTSLVKIKIDDKNVSITIPPAKVLSCKVDDATLTKDSFIIAQNSAAVTAEYQVKVFGEAQNKMLESARGDKALMASAQQRAQKLLEDYVNSIGDLMDKEYSITWVYVDENGVIIE